MSAEVILLVAVAAFLVLVLLEVPVGLSVAIGGTIGIVLLNDPRVAERVLATTPYSSTAKYSLFVIPMYIFLGTLIDNTGIGAGLYRVVNRVLGRLRGGIAMTAVMATALFSGISGSSAADVATFGRLSVNQMGRYGYDRAYASAVVAAAGTFAVLIPPSIILVIYAIIAGESIAAMIMAGLIPGIVSAILLMVFVFARGRVTARTEAAPAERELVGARAGSGPAGPPRGTAAVDAPQGGSTKLTFDPSGKSSYSTVPRPSTLGGDLLAFLYVVVIFVIVIGGLNGGFFTATEAGAFGAFAALVIAILAKSTREKPLRNIIASSLRETAGVTSMIFLLLIGGAIFGFLISSSGLPFRITDWALALPIEPWVIVVIFLLILLVVGMFLDGLTMLVLTVPLAIPVFTGLGFDGIWLGILIIKVIEIGLITPPVGINAFIISGLVKEPVTRVFVRLVPFVLLDIVVTAILFAFPEIILWLPRAAGLL